MSKEDMMEFSGTVQELPDGLILSDGTPLHGGLVSSHNDHRIAMLAALAACACTAPVTLRGAEAVKKSYPRFWEEYRILGGKYEQFIR